MNIKKSVFCSTFFSIIVLLQACNTMEKNQLQIETEEQSLAGHYIYGHEVNTFQPCNKEGTFWVIGSNEELEVLRKEYLNYATKSYDEVFVEITGDYRGKSSDGFAMDYDGQIQIESMLTIRKKSHSDCTTRAQIKRYLLKIIKNYC